MITNFLISSFTQQTQEISVFYPHFRSLKSSNVKIAIFKHCLKPYKFPSILFYFLLTGVFILSGCANEESDWKAAKSANTIEAYEEYQKKYPETPYNDSVVVFLEQLYFAKAEKGGTTDLFKDFIRRFPKSENVKTAQQHITGLELEQAKKTNTVEAYKDFIKKWQGTEQSKEASRLMMELAYAESLKTGSFESLHRFVEENPDSPVLNEASKHIMEEYTRRVASVASLAKKQAIEEVIITDVLKNGPRGRFTIKRIKPENDSPKCSVTLEEAGGGKVLFKTFYPKDRIPFSMGGGGPEIMGPGSIHRIIGKIAINGGYIKGDKKDPLAFLLHAKYGYVYLYGRGVVTVDGVVTQLP